MKLSVVVPCYNEMESLNNFYEKVTTKLEEEKITYELIMVNDGSSDDTINILRQLASKNKNIKVISFSRNFGKESAMLAGLSHAKGEYIGIMDADLQHTPEALISMYNKLIENKEYDVVASYKENRNDESTLRRTLVSIFYKLNNKISNVKMLPGASDFRVFKKCVKDAIISLPETNRFLKGIFSWIGFNTIYVPYVPEARVYGKSKWSVFKLLKYAIGGLVSFSCKPLKSIFAIGLLAFIIGLVNFILMGNLSHRVIILFLSLILLSIGIICLYISRIYNNALKRPNYIIKETINM